MDEKVKKLIDDLSKDPDIIEIVKKIEGKIKTTKGHYGDYMAVFSGMNRQSAMIMGFAMIKAGADSEGVTWALKLTKGA